MPEDPTPATRSLSPWWLLLLLPVGLAIGWLVGELPTPKPREPKAAAPQGGTAALAPAESPRAVAATAGGVTTARGSDPAPAETARPALETQRAEVSQWTTLESAMAESRRNGKPVLIDFSADWCGPCQRMKQQVFENRARGQAVQTAVIPVSIVDRAREDGSNPLEVESLQQRYQVNAFPTLIVFSPASGRMMKTQGFGDADRTVAWITEAATAVR